MGVCVRVCLAESAAESPARLDRPTHSSHPDHLESGTGTGCYQRQQTHSPHVLRVLQVALQQAAPPQTNLPMPSSFFFFLPLCFPCMYGTCLIATGLAARFLKR